MKCPDLLSRPASGALLPLLLALLLLPVLSGQAQRLRLGTLVPKGSSYYNELRRMGEDWKRTTDGSLSLTIYPSGSLGSESQMVRAMRLGRLQACLLSAVGLSEIEPGVSGLQNLPMMFESLEEVDHVNRKLHPRLEERMREKGFQVLFWANAGWVRFFSSTPFSTPDELKRLKLFTWAGSPEVVDIYRNSGYRPVPLETREILTGLQTGLISVVPLPPFIANATQADTRAPYMLDIEWAPLVGAAVVTTRTWDRLEAPVRQLILDQARECGRRIQAVGREEALKSIDAMKQRGLVVRTPTVAQRAQWKRAAQEAHPRIRGTVVPAEIFDRVVALIDEYRTAR